MNLAIARTPKSLKLKTARMKPQKALFPLCNLFFWFSILYVQGQDPYFSQFFSNRVYLNPAYAGFDPGGAVALNYREQWFGVSGSEQRFGAGYRTMGATVDVQAPCFLGIDQANMGFSFSAFRDEAGGAPLTVHGLAVALSHERALVKPSPERRLRRLDLRVGAQLQYGQQQLFSDYLLYSDQLDPVVGLIGDPTALRLQSSLYPNMNTGVLLRGNYQRNKDKSTLFAFGAQMANLNEPYISLFEPSTTARIPRRLTVHGGFTTRIPRYKGAVSPLYFAPQFRWDRQLGSLLNLQTVGAYVFSQGYFSGVFVQYNFPNDSPPPGLPAAGGFLTRNTTTLILNAGIDLRSAFDGGKPWRKRDTGTVLGLTYDINLSGLNQQTTLGVLELSLRTRFGRRNEKSCGELGQFELYKGDCPVRF